MANLYFKYGVMGSSKTAQALIAKFNYENGNNKVFFIKPATDTRDGASVVKSRIGIKSSIIPIENAENIVDKLIEYGTDTKVIICDEAQFFTERQIDQLKLITIKFNIPVICYGLLTDFQTHLFPGSKRLIELADSLQEIKMVCKCGDKAQINARYLNNTIITDGEQVSLGEDNYKSLCFKCFLNELNSTDDYLL